jgi:tetratricopeptide (TPR) repeat protein
VTDIPYLRNTKFTGRYRELGNLFATFVPKASDGSSPCAALYGLGGIGKTQTAIEFVYRLQKRYPHYSVFWIQANDEISFQNSYKKIAELFDIPVDKKESLDIIKEVNIKLAQAETGKWLMVVDGADDLGSENSLISATVRKDIPRHSSGGILFTTRSRDIVTKLPQKYPVRIIEVDEMNEQEATALMYRSLQKDRQEILQDKATTKEFLKLLCYLPLALIQATAYFNEVSHMTIEKYISMFRAQRGQAIELLEEGKLDNDDMDDSAKRAVATTWLISFEQIQQYHELAGEFMKFSSAIRDEAIPDDIFPDTKYKALTIKQERAIGTLVGFGFLKQQTDGRFYNMHRLVHLVIQSWLEKKHETSIWIQRVSERLTQIIPFSGHEDRDKWTGYLPHGLQVAKSTDFAVLPEEQRMSLIDRIGNCYNTLGQYVAAEPLFEEALQLSKKVLGLEHPDTLTSMNKLAVLYKSKGKYEAAEPLYKETLQLRKKVLDLEHPNTLTSMNNLALLYKSQGKYEAAESFYKETLQLRKKVLGLKHPDTLGSMNNLAVLYQSQGKYEAAESLYKEALQLRKKVLGLEHPDTLTSMNNLALLYQSQGKYEAAESLYKEALQLSKKVLGLEHPNTLTSMNNLALLYKSQGKYEAAEPLYKETLQLSKKVLGLEHPNTLGSMNNLADLYQSQGKYEAAESLYKEALQLRKKVLGLEHPDTLTSMNNLADLYKSQGKYEAAEPLYKETLQLRKKVLGPEN